MDKYKIFDIRKSKPGNRLYFFDANVWLFIIDRSLEPAYYEEPYIQFWDELTNESREARKVVVANSLLISEILNRFLRLKFDIFKEHPSNKGKKLDFKKDYRGTKDYKENLIAFSSEFVAYSTYIEIINDCAETIDVIELLETLPPNADFNDHFYYRFCKVNDFPIITHDGDFAFQDIPILTCNKQLLELK